jgi:membrane protease YdiL (CAAX protease family)
VNDESLKERRYRVKPSLSRGLIIVIVYAVILIVLENLSGVPYTDITKSSANVLYGVLIPVAVCSLVLTIFALWSGWWKDVWRDKYQIKNHTWMHIFWILVVIVILANLFAGNISSLDTTFVAYALIATALVGYSEELLARGLLLQGARASALTEVRVFIVTSVVFGLLHGLNIVNGQAVETTIQQIVFSALFGGVLYTIFRKTGFLVVLMILHALWDFSLLTQGTSQVNQIVAAASGTSSTLLLVATGASWLSYILLIPAVRNFNVKKRTEERNQSSST